jgi:hypothetical protein
MINYKYKYLKYKKKYKILKNNKIGGSSNNLDYDTSKLKIRKDIFEEDEIEECKKSVNYGPEFKTNKKFKNFVQMYYHAGDVEDLEKYLLKPLKNIINQYKYEKINNKNNIFNNLIIKISKLYNKNSHDIIKKSLFYQFNKFKKGLFVSIKNGKIEIYLPFSNVNYKNTFENYLLLNNENKKNYDQLIKLKQKKNLNNKEKNRYDNLNTYFRNNLLKFSKQNKKRYLYDRNKWVANNCIFRNTYPEYEGDKLTSEYKYLLEELLKNRTIPDINFFINLRDFPLLKNDLSEPYEEIYNSTNKKMEKQFIFKNYTPVLSRSTTDKFADIAIPTEDDIYRISNKIFPDKCKNSYTKSNITDVEIKWENKLNEAIFMGQATGCGITINDNMRLKAAYLSLKYPQYLKAGITGWNKRLKKNKNKPLQIINPNDFEFKKADKMSRKDISKYKYQLEIDGHVSPFRMSFDMSYNSVLLIVKSKYKMWFSDLLKPYVHYIPIKNDLSDLIDQIKWCTNNDDKCKKISKNAMDFYNKYLTKDGIFDYMQKLFIDIVKLQNE